jgi:hypothetical protein
MRIILSCVKRLYAGILKLYPRDVRDEFADEMKSVFAVAVTEAAQRGAFALAGVCWRELRDLPLVLLREYRFSSSGWEESVRAMIETPEDGTFLRDEPTFWREALLGMIPLLLLPFIFAIAFSVSLLSVAWSLAAAQVGFIVSVIVPLMAFGWMALLIMGWVKGFPRWCFSYWGLTLFASVYLMLIATPGLTLFGYAFGQSEMWGWRAWILLLIVSVISLALTRSTQPLRQLVSKVWRDWTLLSFAYYGTLPLTYLIVFDEVHGEEPFAVGLLVFLAFGALAFIRSTTLFRRALSLVVALFFSWVAAATYLAIYWNGRQEYGMMEPGDGLATISDMSASGLRVLAFLLAPILLALFRRSINRWRPA